MKKEKNVHHVTWDEFKNKVSAHLRKNLGPRICRGQSNSSWKLSTTFHRHFLKTDLPKYFEVVAHLADIVGTLEKREIDTRDAEVNGSFLAYLQHHGFPTPLLDWTLSPYIAAYFAFSDVNDRNLESDHVSVFVFDYEKWAKTWEPIYDYTITNPHVSLLRPKAAGNRRQINQQGYYYLWTNVRDIEAHVKLHQDQKSEIYLEKYNLDVKERFLALQELEVMGITAFSLFGSIESLCQYFKNSIVRSEINKMVQERLDALLASSHSDQ